MTHGHRFSSSPASGDRFARVHLSGTVRIVDNAAEVSRLNDALDAKYAGFRPDAAVLPATTKARYTTSTFLCFIPEGRILTVGKLADAQQGSLATGHLSATALQSF